MSWARRSACAVLTAVLAASTAACTSEGEGAEGPDGAASCAYRVTYGGRTYQDVADVEFAVGGELGTATEPPCDDTGQDADEDTATTETAFAVDGISPEAAIAVGETPERARLVAAYTGNELPPEVEKLIAGP
ncbi:DUF6281 family protein [Streptomyces sp. NPDC056405]|uniref:DUF6281 family protein n=1 Tax=Streptomyces sp. NPDC056405 TaxID=3345811 RepID=UPI0035DC4C1C